LAATSKVMFTGPLPMVIVPVSVATVNETLACVEARISKD